MREQMQCDVVIVGGGPAGLAAAIRLGQLARERQQSLSICVLEKGSEIGAHILSGAVMDPGPLQALLPEFIGQHPELFTAVTSDRFWWLTEKKRLQQPSWLLPPALHNHGNYIVSLGQVCRQLAAEAEALGVDIFPGFAANELLVDDNNRVIGVATGDMGLDKHGQPTDRHQPGMELLARYTLFAEGCRGHLGKQLRARYQLEEGRDPAVYGLGLKELWEVPEQQHEVGAVLHTTGWPLNNSTYGGSFLYQAQSNLIAVGFVVGLGYANPYLSPFAEFQRYKTHPAIRPFFEGGRRISYGARAIYSGGVQAMPKLVFPGGALIGDDAGFLNFPRIKGSHSAIASGCLAADACFEALCAERSHDVLDAYPAAYAQSALAEELHRARNVKPWLSKLGLYGGSVMVGMDQLLLRGKAPWTLHHSSDHGALKPAADYAPIDYPKPDGVVSFDLLSSVFLSNTNHEEEQPCHLQLANPAQAISLNWERYRSPETRYCPAGVYEIVEQAEGPSLRINAQNCLHCKTCDIKDPGQNINWVAPQGGEGPNYAQM